MGRQIRVCSIEQGWKKIERGLRELVDGVYKYGIHLTPGLAEVRSTLRS